MIYTNRNSYPARHTDATKLRAYLPCSLASYQPKSSRIICRTGHDSSYIVLMSCLSNHYPPMPGFVAGIHYKKEGSDCL